MRADIEKWDQIDSPEIPHRGETSEIPHFGGTISKCHTAMRRAATHMHALLWCWLRGIFMHIMIIVHQQPHLIWVVFLKLLLQHETFHKAGECAGIISVRTQPLVRSDRSQGYVHTHVSVITTYQPAQWQQRLTQLRQQCNKSNFSFYCLFLFLLLLLLFCVCVCQTLYSQ